MAFNLNKIKKDIRLIMDLIQKMFLCYVSLVFKKNLPEFLGGFKKNIKIYSNN